MHFWVKLGSIAAASVVWLMPHSANADIDWAQIDLAQERAAIENFQAYDQVLQDVGWALAKGNAEFCPRTLPAIGLQVQDLATYGSPEVGRVALGMTGDFAVQTAAEGSPAALVSELSRNREIMRIGTEDPNLWPSDEDAIWRRAARAHDLIDWLLARDGVLSVGLSDGGAARIEPVLVCAGRFEVLSRSDAASATAKRVLIGTENPAFHYPRDEFAALVAHEFAHLVLEHTAWRDRNGRSQRNIRITEQEADRLMPWLLANAGYDPREAMGWLERNRPASGGFLFFRGTHNKWRDRVAVIESELPVIEAVIARHGKADWATYFRREVDPNQGLEREADG